MNAEFKRFVRDQRHRGDDRFCDPEVNINYELRALGLAMTAGVNCRQYRQLPMSNPYDLS